MTKRACLAAALAIGAIAIGSGRIALRAQGPQGTAPAVDPQRSNGPPATGKPSDPASLPRVPIDEALSRPFTFPFGDETTLDAVAKTLSRSLGAQVVLDVAALKRLDITPEEHVKLDLRDVRLKTGLKLLLDQAEMTFKVVPEDNLLILTDAIGAGDSTAAVLEQLKELHRDVHRLQDAVDELTDMIAPAEEAGPAIRKPTIIEEMPDDKDKARDKDAETPPRSRPGI